VFTTSTALSAKVEAEIWLFVFIALKTSLLVYEMHLTH
jgi:hypothetical protein